MKHNLRTEALRLLKAIDIHGCDLLKLRDEATRLKLEINKLDNLPTDLYEGVRLIFDKLETKEKRREAMSQNVTERSFR